MPTRGPELNYRAAAASTSESNFANLLSKKPARARSWQQYVGRAAHTDPDGYRIEFETFTDVP
jgi:hypothetical protein